MRPLVVVGPTPPPFHGVAVSTALVLANQSLGKRFQVEHLDTSDRRSIENLGRWDFENMRLAVGAIVRLNRMIDRRGGALYLPLSENAGGFLRDSLLIWSARARGWSAAAHIRNSLFKDFYAAQPRPVRWWIRATMRRLTGVAVLGESLRGLMVGFVDDARIAVVPNGTPDFVRPECQRDESLVLYLSNLSRKKGADLAVRAALHLADADAQARFVFAGAWESPAFEREVRALAAPMNGRIKFVGTVTGVEKARLMASAQVLLFPVAWGEGHPRILLEALAAGLPAVTTDRATIRETVADGETGYVLPDPMPDALAEALLRLLHDTNLRERMSRAARQRYLENFTQDRADQRLANWLSSVAASGRPVSLCKNRDHLAKSVNRGELLFLAPGDAAKGRVEPISWMRTCEAFAAAGLRVTLRTLRVRRPDAVRASELWDHYGIAETFKLVSTPTALDREASVWQFRLWAGSAALLAAGRVLVGRIRDSARPCVVYARTPVLLAPFVAMCRILPASLRPTLVFETHTLPTQQNGWIVRASDLVVVNSEKLAAEIEASFGVSRRRVLHAPLPPYNSVRPAPRDAARQKLSLPPDAVIGCYTGKVTPEHSDFLLAAARDVAQRIDRFLLLVVGGNPESLEWTRRRADELGVADAVIRAGFVPPAAVETYQAAADVLVNYIPKSAGTLQYATPSKAYEYQAAERPIVVTDFPLFSEVFGEDGERAIRVTDLTPAGLADGIVRALTLPDGGRGMVQRGAQFVRGRTWAHRAEAVLDALRI